MSLTFLSRKHMLRWTGEVSFNLDHISQAFCSVHCGSSAVVTGQCQPLRCVWLLALVAEVCLVSKKEYRLQSLLAKFAGAEYGCVISSCFVHTRQTDDRVCIISSASVKCLEEEVTLSWKNTSHLPY